MELALETPALARPRRTKRAIDLTLGAALLVASAPLMALVAAAIKLTSRGPVLYAQERVGEGGRRFVMHKFRTMRVGGGEAPHRDYVRRWISADEPSADGLYKLAGDPRVFALGAVLRRSGLDELPQLWNVLRGDMSLVGPRPALPYEVELYTAAHRRRLAGLPGLTGLWQVSGRYRVGFERMVELDVEYLRRSSVWLDLRILLQTPRAMLGGR